MLYGAILGDIIGSPYEFDEEMKTKDFELFSPDCRFTDDTVMTLAIAKALLLIEPNSTTDDFRQCVIKMMKQLGLAYNNVGYGGNFFDWLLDDKPKPYGSWGNGSAMRVSAVGWAFDSIEKTREYARASADVTHNHPEGIKGAEAVAASIYLARTGHSKEYIKKYISDEFHYDLNRTIEQIRPGFKMDESCQGTVPESIIGFLESDSYEDTLRNVISLGGYTDTTGAIAGSIAEAFYGIPEYMIEKCRTYLDERLLTILDKFIDIYEGNNQTTIENN